jgi:putative ABC transport system permease protein
MLQDIRYGLRCLTRNPGFTIVAVLTLAVGIGLNTAIFSLADGMLFRPLPFRDPDRLVMIHSVAPKTGQKYTRVDRIDYEQIRHHHSGIEGIALLEQGGGFTWVGSDGAESIGATVVSPNLLDLLGVSAAAGRPLHEGDERAMPRVAMLTYDAWRRRFALDPAVIGRTITFDQGSIQIVGILPARFIYPFQGSLMDRDLLLVAEPDPKQAANPRAGVFTPLLRLKPGVSLRSAQTEVDVLVRRAAQQFPETRQDRALELTDLQYAMFELSRPMVWLLLGAASLVVMIACVNLASLLMARGTGRLREIGIRAAIGANRARLVRQLLTESLLLGILGGAVALGLASLAFQWLVVQAPTGTYRLLPTGIEPRAVLYALSTSVLAGVVFGILPAWRLSLAHVISSMRGSGTGPTADGLAKTGTLVAIEVALGVVLLCAASLMGNSLVRMRTVDLGFEASRALTLGVLPPATRYPTADQRYDFQMRLLERVRQVPGVQVAGAIEYVQIGGIAPPRGLGPNLPRDVGLWGVTPGYFAAMATPVLRGRDVTARDAETDAPVVLVNESGARLLWPAGDPLGKELRVDGWPSPFQVVGVVKDTRYGYGREAAPSVYRVLSRREFRTMSIVARATGNLQTVAAAMRTEAQRLDPRIVVARPDTLVNALSRGLAMPRFQTTLFGLFAVLGLLLAAIGVYGVMAYWVSGRTREMGVRLALGADPQSLRRLVLAQASKPLFVGLVVGLAGAFALTRRLQASLYEITPHDPVTLASASLVLVAAGLAAAYFPARRASRVDPLIALRTE